MFTQRHKLFVHFGENTYPDIPSVDVGFEVAKYLQQAQMSGEAMSKINEFLLEILGKFATNYQNSNQKAVFLKNIALLCEPILPLNVEAMLLELSKHYIIVIAWEGTGSEDKKTLFWANSQQVALKFDIQLLTL